MKVLIISSGEDIIDSQKQNSTNGRPVYVSTARNALQTANSLFSDAAITEEKLLDEVRRRNYDDTGKERPETKAQVIARADKLIALLEEKGQDCILVSHPVFIKTLRNRFRKHGYCITGGGVFRIAPLDRILITKRDMHCGGCGHNCLLTNPGCEVGKDAARRRNI